MESDNPDLLPEMTGDKLDHLLLVQNSLQCRRLAQQAATSDEQDRWLKMANAFLKRAEEIE